MTVPDPTRWRQLSPLLDELLDLPEAQRDRRIELLRFEDAGLAAELAALLAAGTKAAGARFMDGTAMHSAAAATGEAPNAGFALPAPAASAPTLAGTRIVAYTLTVPLGQGGTGTVWRARRDDGRFSASVAIKLLHLSLLGRTGADRFQREGEVLAQLAHPNIARLLDAGVTPGGQPYLVLELVEGVPIDRHCEALHLDLAQRLALFADVVAAVVHAHRHLVVHRDIKPANILVGADGVVKLLDFGIAKLLEDEPPGADGAPLTREGGRVLTPDYASPEQLRGQPITTATDVYLLGVLLHELLTGQPRFTATQRATGPLHPTLTQPAPRPSAAVRDPRLRRRLEGDLDTIVLRALKEDPLERYPTASALADDLRRHLDGQPVLARPDSVAYRARKFVLRHRAGSAIVAAVLLALLGGAHAQVAVLIALAIGAGAALWQAGAARQQALAARLAQQRAEEVKRFIASLFTAAVPRESSGGVVTAIDLLHSATDRIEAELAPNPRVAGELGVLIARSCSHLGDMVAGERAVRAALARCRQAFGERDPLTLQARVLLQEACDATGQFDESEALAVPLVADLRALMPAHPSLLVEALRGLSFVMAKRQREDASFAPLHEAIAIGEAHLGPQHAETIYTLGLLSNTCSHFGRYPQALDASAVALDRAQQAYGPLRPHTELTSLERWHATALVQCGRPAEAEPLARQVVADQLLLDAGPSQRVVNAMSVHGLALLAMGRVDAAVRVAREVLARYEQLNADETHDSAAFVYRLAQSLATLRRPDEVAALLDREERIWNAQAEGNPSVRVRHQRLRAQLAIWQGQRQAADALLALLEGAAPVRPDEHARGQRLHAQNLRLHGAAAQAVAAAHAAVASASRPGVLTADLALAHTELALGLLEVGDLPAAGPAFDDAVRCFEQAQVELGLVRADCELGLGRAHLALGRPAEAQAVFAAVERCWCSANPGSEWHAQARHWLARAHLALGTEADLARARDLFQEAAHALAASPLPDLSRLAGPTFTAPTAADSS